MFDNVVFIQYSELRFYRSQMYGEPIGISGVLVTFNKKFNIDPHKYLNVRLKCLGCQFIADKACFLDFSIVFKKKDFKRNELI